MSTCVLSPSIKILREDKDWDDEPTPALVDAHYLSIGLSRPQRIGFFSSKFCFSDGSVYYPDKRSLPFLDPKYQKTVGTNLLEGYSREKGWGRGSAGPMNILKWLSDNKEQLEGPGQRVDFICHSRSLKTILETKFPIEDKWKIYAVKVRGSIILNELDTEDQLPNHIHYHKERLKGSYAGYKFVEEITRRADGSKQITYPGGIRDSFHLVNKWEVKGHSLLYSYRIDCALNEAQLTAPLNEMDLALIRTRSSHMIYKKEQNMDRSISWWATSLVSGAARIICGQKTQKHRLKRISTINGLHLPIPKYILSDRLHLLDDVLTAIKERVKEELTVYCFEIDGEGQIGYSEIHEPVEKYIPSWYLNGQSSEQLIDHDSSHYTNRMRTENISFSPIMNLISTKDSILASGESNLL